MGLDDGGRLSLRIEKRGGDRVVSALVAGLARLNPLATVLDTSPYDRAMRRLHNYMKDDPATEGHEAHGFAPHYDQHVWLWRENPGGVFAQYNPMVTCAFHGLGHEHAHHGHGS